MAVKDSDSITYINQFLTSKLSETETVIFGGIIRGESVSANNDIRHLKNA